MANNMNQYGLFWDFVRSMDANRAAAHDPTHRPYDPEEYEHPPHPFSEHAPPPPQFPFGFGAAFGHPGFREGPARFGGPGPRGHGHGHRGRHGRRAGRHEHSPSGSRSRSPHHERSGSASSSPQEGGAEDHPESRGPPPQRPHDGHGPRGPHGPRGRGGRFGSRGAHRGPFGPRGGAPFDLSALVGALASHPIAQAFQAYAQQPGFGADEAQRSGETHVPTTEDENSFTPPIDIFSTPSAYVLHVAIAGAKKEDVGVNWDPEKNELNIAGVVYRQGDEEFLQSLTRAERKVGVFERIVKLPVGDEKEEVDGDAISAKLDDGVLVVTVGKVEKEWTEVKRIDIN
ncbi:MAG: hypothetical protein M1818_001625 [Claussenomyces sp. TS43310]|nr:MAG: hypothetical protein M1818_001625 [Claussenomyces sp. TS43310]